MSNKELCTLWERLLKEQRAKMAILKKTDDFAFRFTDTYVQNPSLIFGTNYHFEEMSNLKGELHIIGLSPNNDEHIFRYINESYLDKIYFYYLPDDEEIVIPVNKPCEKKEVEELWESLNAKRKIYNCSYQLPNDKRIDEFIKIFNAISLDPVSRKDIIDEANSIPPFKAKPLYEMVKKELEEQRERGNPENEDELTQDFNEISRIALREGILPSALFMVYTMNDKNNERKH